MRIVRNELYVSDDGSLRPRPTDQFEDLQIDMVFRSVGYRGVPLAALPFHDRWGIVPNEKGRVVDPETDQPLTGIYVAGWIKRGPTGVIGTNKPDAAETVSAMLEDVAAGKLLQPRQPDRAAVEERVRRNQPEFVSWADWLALQELEEARGKEQGRPRVKFTSLDEMLVALDRG